MDCTLLDQVPFASVLSLEASTQRLLAQNKTGALESLWKGPVCGSEKPMIPLEIQTVRVQMLQKMDLSIFI